MGRSEDGAGKHIPVLLEEVLEDLNIRPAGVYVDGTFGRGGHSRAVLDVLGPDGRLLAIDRDPQAINEVGRELIEHPAFELIRGEFGDLRQIAMDRGLQGRVDGILLDLGVSSPQLDQAERGFSFQQDGPLDMRMDPDSGQSAADWLNTVTEGELKRVLRQNGEEPAAGRIAKAIVAARAEDAIATTGQLARIVESASPRRGQRKHPATRTFQAIRMHINDERGQLEKGLDASLDLLAPGGRLCVISFHSLEDRAVKRFMRRASVVPEPYRGLPDVPEQYRPQLKLVGKAHTADDAEALDNPRSRSARLRTAERI